MHVTVGETFAVGDLCALSTAADFTIKETVNDAAVFGRVVAISHTGTAGVGTADTIASVEVFGYNAVIEITTNAAVALGVSLQTNVAGANNVETATTTNLYNTLVIGDVTNADATHTLSVLV
jgi:hypothetical protein